jgi:DNA-binding transcriptional LysR family regulator
VGAKLLVRTTRKVALTEAGAAYAASARRVLEIIDETERIAAGEFFAPRGELVLTAPVLFGRLHVLPVVADFLALYPEINVRLVLTDRSLHLIDEHIDMAARIGSLPESRMIATRIGSMRTVVCASPQLLTRHGVPKSPEDLADWPCVNFDFRSPSSTWLFRSKDGIRETPVKPRLSVSTAEAAVRAAAHDVGLARVLHYQCANAVREGSLKFILEDFEIEPLPVHLIHAARGALPLKMRAFLDFAVGRMRKAIASL